MINLSRKKKAKAFLRGLIKPKQTEAVRKVLHDSSKSKANKIARNVPLAIKG